MQQPNYMSKREELDRKAVSTVKFTGEKGLLLFKEDIKAQCLYRTMWDLLLTVSPNATTTFFIVNDFLLMKEKVMERARRGRTAPESRAARNMHEH